MKKFFILTCLVLFIGHAFASQKIVANSSKYSRHIDFSFITMSEDGNRLISNILTDGYYQLLIVDTNTYETELVKFWGDILDAEFISNDEMIVAALDNNLDPQIYLVDKKREIYYVSSLKDIPKDNLGNILIFPIGAFEDSQIRLELVNFDGSSTSYNLDAETLEIESSFNFKHPNDFEILGSTSELSVRQLWNKEKYKTILVENGKETVLHESEFISDDHLSVYGFSAEGNLFLKRSDGNTRSLYEYSIKPFKEIKKLWSNDAFDFNGYPLYLRNTKIIPGFVVRSKKPEVLYINEQVKNYMQQVDSVLPGKLNSPIAASKDYKKIVVFSRSDKHPGEYFIYDRVAKQLSPLLSRAEWLSEKEGFDVQEVSYKSKDDLLIRAYLTEPKIRKNAPLIVLPHGGPHSRDYEEYDGLVQYFASLGYAVLQPGYRGSSGYGATHFQKGLKQIGLNMQDDLYAGIQYANKKGYGLDNKVCFVGGSFGAYMSAKAIVDYPEKFKCAIAINGFYDVVGLLEADKEKEFFPTMELIYGSLEKDREYLAKVSITNNVEKIQGDIFVIHASKDKRIDIEQAYELIDLLKHNKKSYLSLIFETEGHSIRKSVNRRKLYLTMGEFLEYVLPVSETKKSNKEQYFALRNKRTDKAIERHYKEKPKKRKRCDKKIGTHIKRCR